MAIAIVICTVCSALFAYGELLISPPVCQSRLMTQDQDGGEVIHGLTSMVLGFSGNKIEDGARDNRIRSKIKLKLKVENFFWVILGGRGVGYYP